MFWFRLRLLKKSGWKIVWTIHDVIHHEASFPKLEARASRSFLKLCDYVIVHTQGAIRDIESRWNVTLKNVLVTPHPSYIGLYENAISQKDARDHLDISPSAFVFLFFGQIRRYKGVDRLIRAFMQIEGNELVLLVAGQPADQDLAGEIEHLAHEDDRIQLSLRHIDDGHIQVLMNASDIVTFPYRRALTSGALLLAMSFAKACIVPSVTSLMDIAIGRDDGFTFEIDSDASLLQAMIYAKDNAHIVKAIGAANFEAVRPATWEAMAEKIAALYDSLLDGPTAPIG